MTITIDPATHVITIPEAQLTLVQSTPTLIYDLNINEFRLALKDWEDSEEGIYQPQTHNHNTETSLGGITYARVVEILSPYTITFEDNQYAVNLVGANSNIGDKINVNQVSVRSQNSAGLISSPDIEYASFQGGVWIDDTTSNTGTIFPTGTPRKMVNNLADAILIDAYRGFAKFYVVSSMTLDSGSNLSGSIIEGRSLVQVDAVIDTNANVSQCTFRSMGLSGVLDGNNLIEDCVLGNLVYVNGHIHNCSLAGSITLGGADKAFISNCSQEDMTITPEIDLGGSGQNLVMPNYSGNISLINSTGVNNKVGIGLDGGKIILNSTTFTHGTVQVSGIGELVDQSANPISSGTWNTNVTIINTLVSNDSVANAVWDETTNDHATAGSTGKSLSDAGGAGNPWSLPVTGNTTSGTFGEKVGNKILTTTKFLALK